MATRVHSILSPNVMQKARHPIPTRSFDLLVRIPRTQSTIIAPQVFARKWTSLAISWCVLKLHSHQAYEENKENRKVRWQLMVANSFNNVRAFLNHTRYALNFILFFIYKTRIDRNFLMFLQKGLR